MGVVTYIKTHQAIHLKVYTYIYIYIYTYFEEHLAVN